MELGNLRDSLPAAHSAPLPKVAGAALVSYGCRAGRWMTLPLSAVQTHDTPGELGCPTHGCVTCGTLGFAPFQSHRFCFILPCSIKDHLRNDALTPVELLGYFKRPVAGTWAAVRAADYMETTLALLKEKPRWAVRGDISVTGRDLTLLGGRQRRKMQGLVTGAWEEGTKGVMMGHDSNPSHATAVRQR